MKFLPPPDNSVILEGQGLLRGPGFYSGSPQRHKSFFQQVAITRATLKSCASLYKHRQTVFLFLNLFEVKERYLWFADYFQSNYER